MLNLMRRCERSVNGDGSRACLCHRALKRVSGTIIAPARLRLWAPGEFDAYRGAAGVLVFERNNGCASLVMLAIREIYNTLGKF